MVNILTNLVKLSDYPFAYSLAGLLLIINGHPLNLKDLSSFFPLISIVGIGATTLTIIDPIGHLIRFILKNSFLIDYVYTVDRLDKYISTWRSVFGKSILIEEAESDINLEQKLLERRIKRY